MLCSTSVNFNVVLHILFSTHYAVSTLSKAINKNPFWLGKEYPPGAGQFLEVKQASPGGEDGKIDGK